MKGFLTTLASILAALALLQITGSMNIVNIFSPNSRIDQHGPRANSPSSESGVSTVQASSSPNNPPSAEASPTELAFWDSIKNSNDPDDFSAYLNKYPNGAFASLARNKLQALNKRAGLESPKEPEKAQSEPRSSSAKSTRPIPRPRTYPQGYDSYSSYPQPSYASSKDSGNTPNSGRITTQPAPPVREEPRVDNSGLISEHKVPSQPKIRTNNNNQPSQFDDDKPRNKGNWFVRGLKKVGRGFKKVGGGIKKIFD